MKMFWPNTLWLLGYIKLVAASGIDQGAQNNLWDKWYLEKNVCKKLLIYRITEVNTNKKPMMLFLVLSRHFLCLSFCYSSCTELFTFLLTKNRHLNAEMSCPVLWVIFNSLLFYLLCLQVQALYSPSRIHGSSGNGWWCHPPSFHRNAWKSTSSMLFF